MDKPLITIITLTYNQEQYVRDAVRGLLSQTYEPLEIIISDDCSTDRTWDIIKEEVESYKQSGGIHKNIILNRNESNLGIVKHFSLVHTLTHGELIVQGAGDDISLPNRVERIVQEWEKGERKATIIHHGYIEIDESGKELKTCPSRTWEIALGAVATYSKRVFIEFPTLEGKVVTIEDQVLSKRAYMIGDAIEFDEPLVRYRVGCGISTKYKTQRELRIWRSESALLSYEHTLIDLDQKKDVIDPKKYKYIYELSTSVIRDRERTITMLTSPSLKRRYEAICAKVRDGRFASGWLNHYIHGYVYLEPKWLADLQVELYFKLKKIFGKHAYSN